MGNRGYKETSKWIWKYKENMMWMQKYFLMRIAVVSISCLAKFLCKFFTENCWWVTELYCVLPKQTWEKINVW